MPCRFFGKSDTFFPPIVYFGIRAIRRLTPKLSRVVIQHRGTFNFRQHSPSVDMIQNKPLAAFDDNKIEPLKIDLAFKDLPVTSDTIPLRTTDSNPHRNCFCLVSRFQKKANASHIIFQSAGSQPFLNGCLFDDIKRSVKLGCNTGMMLISTFTESTIRNLIH